VGAAGLATAQTDDAEAMNQRVIELYNAGKYGEAIPVAERYVEAMKPDTGPTILGMPPRSTTWPSCCELPTSWPRPSL
jgi:hypothetical protein